MRHFSNIEIGCATHTGRVRSSNEDDYLIYVPQSRRELMERGCLFVVADGMGGMVGGAEASRAAVRGVASPFIEAKSKAEVRARMERGFQLAAAHVAQLARENPGLRGMGTTLTAASLRGGKLLVGHVGDSRCLLQRGDKLMQITKDHAVRGSSSYLTRCIGGGQEQEAFDFFEEELQQGDRIFLLTDGLWGVVPDQEISDIAKTLPPQDAADELVRLANRNGGPDNSTVLILLVKNLTVSEEVAEEVDLSRDEVYEPAMLRTPDRNLVSPRWPWYVLVLSLILGALAIAKIFFQLDLLGILWGSLS